MLIQNRRSRTNDVMLSMRAASDYILHVRMLAPAAILFTVEAQKL